MANLNDTFQFLRALSLNNDRVWFNAHKDEYMTLKALWDNDVSLLIAMMSEYDPSLRGLRVADCTYRIYRDLRFSNDKRPYKTHFSAVIGKGGKKSTRAACYLHIEPGNSALYAGIWCPESDVLARLRSEIDANIDEFKEIIECPDFSSHFAFYGEKLKSVPRGFSKDNPNAEYIKMKEYLCVKKVKDEYFFCDEWVEKVANEFAKVMKFNEFLNFVFEED